MFVTVRKNEQIVLWSRGGEGKVIEGPARVNTMFKQHEFLTRHAANEHQYLQIEYLDGHREHIAGPATVFSNPLEYRRVNVLDSYDLNANEVMVVYRKREKTGEVDRRLIYGPTLHVPGADEWLHEFVWHGSENGNKTRKVPGATRFKKLRVMPDQFYYNISDVRTMDEGLITVKVMIFYELKEIETMLSLSHDPIADFINAITADVVAFASLLKYEEFMNKSHQLNELSSFPHLVTRAAGIGYNITKVVFRGFFASDALQRMNDDAVTARTKLKLQMETDQQAQNLADFQLDKESERAERKRKLLATENAHKLEMQRSEHEERMRQKLTEQQQDLSYQEKVKEQQISHLRELKDMGVDLSRYLVAQYQHPDRLIQITGDDTKRVNATGASIHIHD